MTLRPRRGALFTSTLIAAVVLVLAGCGLMPAQGPSAASSDPSRSAAARISDGPPVVETPLPPPPELSPEQSSPGGADAPDADGAAAALESYLELERQVYLTGDVAAAQQMTLADCHACAPRLAQAQDFHSAGFELRGGESTVELQRRKPVEEMIPAEELPSQEVKDLYENIFMLVTTVHQAETATVTGDVEQTTPATSYTLDAALWHDAGRWYVLGLTERS